MKRIKEASLLTLIFLISVSLTSGLELSASTGGNGGSSSTTVVYGANVDDYANEHIGLNPGDGTLSNAFSGSGSLPYGSISKSDTKGNYAQVYRSVSGKTGVTSWNYDWSTYIPSSSVGSGVGAWMTLNTYNAYSINGGSKSSNKEGDVAKVDTKVGSSYPYTTSSLGNYNTYATAFTNTANAYQSADYTTSGAATTVWGTSNNLEKDYATASIYISTGRIDKPKTTAYASKTSDWVQPTASRIYTTGAGKLNGYASNFEGDISYSDLTVTNGAITNPNFYSWSGTGFADAWIAADSQTSTGAASVRGSSNNVKKDYATASIAIPSGTISKPTIRAYTSKTSERVTSGASTISTTGTGNLNAYASNPVGRLSYVDLKVTKGGITNPSFYAAWDGTGVAELAADSTKSTGATLVSGSSNNAEKDYATASIYIPSGDINTLKIKAYSSITSDWVQPTASRIYTTGAGKLNAYASNLEKDSSNFGLWVINGKITNPSFYAWSQKGSAETYAYIPNAYGTLAEINSNALDKAVGCEERWVWNPNKWNTKTLKYGDWDRFNKKVEVGEGAFAAKRINNNPFSSVVVKSTATKNDVNILATGFGANTALILDPRRWEFVTDRKGNEIKGTVIDVLKNKGYAVTYYSDVAVSKAKVKQMDEYKVSAIHTHSSPTVIYLSTSQDGGQTFDKMYPSELKSEYKISNGIALIVGCESFKDTGLGTWADAVSKANIRGGTTTEWSIQYGRDFINKYFTSMSKGNQAWYANLDASGWGLSGSQLSLKGNQLFQL